MSFRVEAPGPSPRTVAPPSPKGGSRLTERIPVQGMWQTRALCAKQTGPLDPKFRFADEKDERSVWRYPELHPRSVVLTAKALCERCPVLNECADQPGPRIGVTAGVVYYGTSPRAITSTCKRCGVGMEGKRSWCSNECRYAWHYQIRAVETVPAGPLLAWFGDVPVTTIAARCRVAARTVYRWQATGEVGLIAAQGVARRLGIAFEDIWGRQ